jgi:hypothetical protein
VESVWKESCAKELRALHPEEVPQYLRPETEEELFSLGRQILDECPEIDVEVNVADDDKGIVIPDVGNPSPIEVYEASIIEQKVSDETWIGPRPIERDNEMGTRKVTKMGEMRTLGEALRRGKERTEFELKKRQPHERREMQRNRHQSTFQESRGGSRARKLRLFLGIRAIGSRARLRRRLRKKNSAR